MSVLDNLNDPDLVWESVCESIISSGDITDVSFGTWFKYAHLIAANSEKAMLTVENELKLQVVVDKYLDIIETHLGKIYGGKPELTVLVNPADAPDVKKLENPTYFRYGIDRTTGKTVVAMPEDKPEAKQETKPEAKPTSDEPGERRLTYNPEYTFETFVVGVSNEFAHAAAQAVAKKPGSVYNPLMIYGPSGLGKTHLMYAITNRILETKPNCNIVYVKGEEFTNQLIEAISNGTTAAFREKYRKADMLLIDDIQFIAGKKSTQEEFFHTFNALYEDHKQIIATSDRPPKDMETLEDRIKTRFESGLLADVQPPDFELRLAILQSKAYYLDLDISNEILNYLADNLGDNIRKIEGVIKKLSAKSFLTGAEVTMEMAKAEVEEYKPQKETASETAKRIINATAKKYGVTPDDILGPSRVKDVKTARNVAMYILRRMTTISLPEIGKLMNRDHATVYSNIKAIESEMKSNSFLDAEVNDIMADLK